MLLVDRVLECDFEKQFIVAIKNVTATEPFLQGHFPGFMCVPGVLQLEAMAQAGGVLMSSMFNAKGKIAYFLSIDKARFRRVVRPGDTMRIEVRFQKARMKKSISWFCFTATNNTTWKAWWLSSMLPSGSGN